MCAVISVQGVLHHHATLGPYNTGHIIAFLDALHAVVQDRPQQPRFVVIWDNVSFHRAALVRDWFNNHNPFTLSYLPPYRPFLNAIEIRINPRVDSAHMVTFSRCLACEDCVDEVLWPDPNRRRDS